MMNVFVLFRTETVDTMQDFELFEWDVTVPDSLEAMQAIQKDLREQITLKLVQQDL